MNSEIHVAGGLNFSFSHDTLLTITDQSRVRPSKRDKRRINARNDERPMTEQITVTFTWREKIFGG